MKKQKEKNMSRPLSAYRVLQGRSGRPSCSSLYFFFVGGGFN